MIENNQNGQSKLKTAILLFIFIPPAGVIYVCKEIKYFSKYLHLILLFFGGWSLVYSCIFLYFLPELTNRLQSLNIENPFYLSLVLYISIFLSVSKIVLAFLINKKQKALLPLPGGYTITAIILLIINNILIPIVFLAMLISVNQSMYDLLRE
jgi:hypothetical protein